MMKLNETKYREEYARHVLISTYPEKYKESSLIDRPDIQNAAKNIGVEVTGTLKQRIRYGVAQFLDLYGQPITSLTAKKKKQLNKNEVRIKADEEGIIKFIIPTAVWGSGNETKEAFNNKLKKLNSGNFRIFNENNLFLFAEGEEVNEVRSLIEYIKKGENTKHKFNYTYLYTYRELYSISIKDYTYGLSYITEEQKMKFEQAAIKVASVK